MKIAYRIIENELEMADDAIKSAFTNKLKEFDFDNIFVISVSSEEEGDAVVVFGDDEGQMIEVLFAYDDDEGAQAIILDPERDLLDDEEDELEIIELDPIDPATLEIKGSLAIDLLNLDWLNETTLQAILTVGDLIANQTDAEGEISERSVIVVRGGKRVRLPLVRRRRRKRLTSKQKNAIRRGAKKRKMKRGQIARARKKSLKLRKRGNLKRNTNKRLKVAGTSDKKF